MSNCSRKRERGFSLLEMVVATALGTLVIAAATQLYIQGVNATWVASQRAEMQQDFRAASNLLTRDLSLAGAGLQPGTAIALPSTSTPQYGCDQSNCATGGYLNGVAGTYPKQGGVPYLYGLLTGYNQGPSVQGQTTDTITVVYTDTSLYLNCYEASISAAGSVTFMQPASPLTWATEGCLPSGVSTPQAVNDPAVGLTTGDLVIMKVSGTWLVVEVTGAITTGTDASGHTDYTVPFANPDALKMNQTAAGYLLNGIKTSVTGTYSPAPCGGAGPCRLLVVTYYIDNTTIPPRLMRQVSGHSPVPVAESVQYLKFTYDLYNTSTSTPAIGCQNPGAATDVCTTGSSAGLSPNQITQIHVANMAMDSTVKGSLFGLGGGDQSIDLQTTVSARNLTYVNNYPQ